MKEINWNQGIQIICCIKITDNLDEMIKEEFKEQKNGYPDTSFVKKMINCFDEAALETALSIKETCKSNNIKVKITVLTLNPGYSEHILHNFPAIGVDNVFVLQDDTRNYDFYPEETADILADFIKKEKDVDMILTGKQASPFNSMLVPVYLSEEMEMPFVTDVTDICFDEKQFHIFTGDGCTKEERCTRQPFVAAVGNADHAYLRVPTLREKLKYKGWKPDIFHVAPIKEQGKTITFLFEQDERKCSFIEGKNIKEKADQMLNILHGVNQ